MLKVSRGPDGRPEIFYSVQGEGVNTGRPALFLRLGLCNLSCLWCDTGYTWDWNIYDPGEQLVEMAQENVEAEISKHDCRYLVVTGGEPLLQQSGLVTLLESLKSKGFFLEIETNGTIIPEDRLLELVDHWSVSPKLESSGNPISREVPRCYRLFGSLSNCHFKYVIQGESELDEVGDLRRRYNIPPEKVILMPEGRTAGDILERGRWVVEACKEQGYLFSTRLHILLWGDKRGV